MLPKLHKKYSKAVLDEFRLPKAAKEQVVLGSIVNDYCELTNDGQIFLNKDTASSHILNTDLFKGKSAIWQSHFGYLTSLHFIQCRDCVESVLKSKLYSTKPILTLSKDARVSGGGVYA